MQHNTPNILHQTLLKYFLILLLSLAGHAQAGGPLSVCSGVPTRYAGAGAITLNYDQGSLGSRSNAQADTLVTEAVSLWSNVSTATVTLAQGSDLPVNVTTANYSSYGNNYSDGLNPVIYDTDGSIIDMLNGVGAKNSILGFASSDWYKYPTYCQYAEGVAVINGYITRSDAEMKITLAHEVGHLIGLDHTQLDSTQGLSSAYGISNYPLMYPIAYRDILSLHEDDAAAVSALYPDVNLGSVYGQLSGTFTQTGGTPIRGANLWAEETGSHQVFSIVSDYLMQSTGYFKLLLPAGTYTLHAEAVQTNFTSGSSVGPYSERSSDPSFQAPLYVGGVAMTPVTLGNGSPAQIAIIAGCSASVGFKLDGSGTVSGNCFATCSYTLDNTSQSAAATGLSGTISVSSTSGCAWTAVSNANWITVISGSSGSGNGSVVYAVAANTGSSARSGTLTIAGQTFSVTQAGYSSSATNFLNPGFESGVVNWSESGAYALITNDATMSHSGDWLAWLGGYGNASDTLYQSVTLPASASQAGVQFWYRISTLETTSSSVYDRLTVTIENATTSAVLATQTLSNLDASPDWRQSTALDVSAYAGQTIRLRFSATTDSSLSTSFFIDDVSLSLASASIALTGTTGNDTLTGGAEDDSLFGLEGSDILTPGAGNNLVCGGTGNDVLVTTSSTYGDVTTLVIAQDTLIVYDGASVRHVVRGVETLRIGGTDYSLPAATDNIEQDLVQIYVAAFARAPELEGYNYWKAEIATKGINEVADIIFGLQAVKDIYPDSLPNTDFVSTIYLSVFGRASDADGLAYWAGQITSGKSRSRVVLDMTTAALGTADGTDGKAYFNNRVDVSKYAVTRQTASGVSRSVSDTLAVLNGADASAGSVVSAVDTVMAW